MSVLYKVFSQKMYPPKPSSQTFKGKTILVTAATGGLGMEAAKKLVTQDTSTLIITGRTQEKANAAKDLLEKHLASTSTKSECNIHALPLEMSSPSSITTFVSTLRTKTQHLDHAILNAGVINTTHTVASTSYESTLQVNTISTILLSLLLTPLLLASPSASSTDSTQRPHLVYVSSGLAWLFHPPDVADIMDSGAILKTISEKDNFPLGRLGGQRQYGRSKLLLEYCMRHVALLSNLKGKIIVCSVCPGMCKSELGRQYATSWVLKLATQVVMGTVARSAQDGANIYVSALGKGEEVRGEMWRDDKVLGTEPEEMMRSEVGVRWGDEVWREVKGALGGMDGVESVREVLGEA